jgi:hypothetical protein
MSPKELTGNDQVLPDQAFACPHVSLDNGGDQIGLGLEAGSDGVVDRSLEKVVVDEERDEQDNNEHAEEEQADLVGNAQLHNAAIRFRYSVG